MKKEYYVGIDYHKKYSTICILDQNGSIRKEATIRPNSPKQFQSCFETLDGSVRAAYECGLNWGRLYDLLDTLDCVDQIVLADAHKTRIIAESQIKTDKIDAYKLAWLLRADLLPAIHIPNTHTRQRREVIRQRMYWVKTRTRLRNRVHRIIERQHDLQMPQVTDLFGKKGKAALRKAVLPEPDQQLLQQDLRMLDLLDDHVRENEAQMKIEAQNDQDTQRIISIPGIGLTIGSVLAAEIDGIERFRSPEQLCAYAGLVPSTYSSGGKTRHGRMLHGANKWLKWGFIEAAWVAVGCSAYFGGLYRTHRARGKKANTAITIVARRMCRIVWRLLKEKRCFEEERKSTSGRLHHGLTESSRAA
jgi:transposase